MTMVSRLVAAILIFVGLPSFGQDSLTMTCAQHGNEVMTLKFVRETGEARSVKVIGQANTSRWTVTIDGQDATPATQTLANPGVVAVHVADTIEFKVETSLHGIIFLSEELARGFLDFDKGAGQPLDNRPPKGEFDWGTEKFDGPDDVLAVANVRALAPGAAPSPEEEVLAKMSPSMQRRMLRIVNRAHRPEDLTKSPQDVQARSEHTPVIVHRSKANATAGFPREMAEAVISSRPLDGYRDLRECLPVYESSGGLDDLSGVLESLGPGQFGQWDEVPGRIPSVMHAAMLHTGKVLFITDLESTVLWDPASAPEILSGSQTGLDEILYCSGHSFLRGCQKTG